MSHSVERVERLMIALAILGGVWAVAGDYLFVALRAVWRTL